jgi:hypothetical protein
MIYEVLGIYGGEDNNVLSFGIYQQINMAKKPKTM